MEKVSIHLGNLTFVIDRNSLTKSLGVFQSNGPLKSSTSYRVKSQIQRNVLRDFLLAARSNIIPKITPENRSQMIELSKEFEYHNLQHFLSKIPTKVVPHPPRPIKQTICNYVRTNVKVGLPKRNNPKQQLLTLKKDVTIDYSSLKLPVVPQKDEKNEQIKSISEEKVIDNEKTNVVKKEIVNSSQKKELEISSSSLYDSYSYDYEYSSSSLYDEEYESDSNVDFDLSDDDIKIPKEIEESKKVDSVKMKKEKSNENESSGKEKTKKIKSKKDDNVDKEKAKKEKLNKDEKINKDGKLNKNEKPGIQKQKKFKLKKVEKISLAKVEKSEIRKEHKNENLKNTKKPEIKETKPEPIIEKSQLHKPEPVAESQPSIPNNTTESSSSVLLLDESNSRLTPIQIMALNLQRALFGDSSTEEPSSSSSQSLMQANSESDSSENVSFKNRIIQLEYVLFGLKPNDRIEHHNFKNNTVSNSSQELDRINFPAVHSQTKRAPRHTNRHLPSVIIKDD